MQVNYYTTLFSRIDTHCNTGQVKQTENKYLHSIFIKNNYPRNFINKVQTKIRNKQRINKSNKQPIEQSKTTITLPLLHKRHI